jgi:hypothetical protein
MVAKKNLKSRDSIPCDVRVFKYRTYHEAMNRVFIIAFRHHNRFFSAMDAIWNCSSNCAGMITSSSYVDDSRDGGVEESSSAYSCA